VGEGSKNDQNTDCNDEQIPGPSKVSPKRSNGGNYFHDFKILTQIKC